MLNPIKLPPHETIQSVLPAGRAKKDELIITASHKGEIIALLRLKSVDKVRLLTGMLVIPKVRGGTGIGKELLTHCKKNVFTDGDYCFAFTHLESYYSKHGFTTIDCSELPHPLKMAFQRYVDSGKDLIPMQFISSTTSKRVLL
ncbi:LOW QUALITY PROTEIN: predicted acyltransferase [Vibrio sp. JCM 18904]|nr:LOW QUALITY PROTEIN: predicted acyltransferase [Vibrio sp. JCM 18904]